MDNKEITLDNVKFTIKDYSRSKSMIATVFTLTATDNQYNHDFVCDIPLEHFDSKDVIRYYLLGEWCTYHQTQKKVSGFNIGDVI